MATHVFRKGDREFRLIGVSHVAEQSFWTTVLAELACAEARGFEIHYERIRHPPGVKSTGGTRGLYGWVARTLQLVSQHDGFPIQPGWHNTDMSEEEILDAAGDARPKLQAWLNKTSKPTPDDLALSPGVTWLLRRLIGTLVAVGFGARDPDVRRVIGDVRSDYAIAAMLARGRSVATVWGAGHVPRMAGALIEAGFELTCTRFVTAIAKTPGEFTRIEA